MPFERAFKSSSLFLAASAFCGLILAGSVPIWLAALTGTLLTLALLQAWGISTSQAGLEQIGRAPRLPNILLITAFLLFLADLVLMSRELLSAGIHFLVLLLGIKLLTLNQRRDYRHLYAISLMGMLASAALTTETWYVPIFLLYLLAAVWTLLLYHLTDDQPGGVENGASCHLLPVPGPKAGITSRFFWLTNGVASATFVLTLAIFFLLPRIGAGLLQKARGEALRTTGFSERVDLGTIASVKQDPQVVMRVELPERPGGMDRLYLRGVAYDHYSGRSWTASRTGRRSLGMSGDGTYIVRSAARGTERSSLSIQQDILLEALDTAVLFAAPFPESVSGDLPGVQSDGMAALYLPFPSSSRIRYSVVSRQPQLVLNDQTVPTPEYPRSILERYLQLPELSDKVAELSQEVVRSAATPNERIIAVQDHLQRSYRYSLNVETAASLHPLEDFLFDSKSGYCEHYATAMVIMLRAVGVPARLVTGFLATEWNEFGGYFTVRQRDAHAWVEVYLASSGWMTFDPTPSAETTPVRSVWETVFRMNESLRLYWDRLFVHYSIRDQWALVQEMKERGDAVRGHANQWISALTTLAATFRSVMGGSLRSALVGWVSLLALLAALSAFAIIAAAKKTPWSPVASWRGGPRRRLHIVTLYKRMLQVLSVHGLRKSSAVTPGEFCRFIETEWQSAAVFVKSLTQLYCQGRFGRLPLSAEDLSEAERQLRELRQLSRTMHS
jgi:transglutaminase-like putative cysteine protease